MRKVRLLAEYSSPSLLHNFLIVLIISCDTLLLPNNFSINSDQEGKQSMLAWQCIIVWKLMRLLYVCVLLVLDRCTHLSTTPFKVSLACVLETLDYSPSRVSSSPLSLFTLVLVTDNHQLWEVRVGQKTWCVAQGVCVKTDGF